MCLIACALVLVVFPDVQQQLNQYDCGLFALAFASSVCVNLDPATNYEQRCLRLHFLKNGEFPVNPINKTLSEIHVLQCITRRGMM